MSPGANRSGRGRVDRVYISLGSNIGDRAGRLRLALTADDTAQARLVLVELLREIHPGADCQAIDEVSVVMVAALEGLTLFAGHGKAWSGARSALERRCKKALAALAADA